MRDPFSPIHLDDVVSGSISIEHGTCYGPYGLDKLIPRYTLSTGASEGRVSMDYLDDVVSGSISSEQNK